MFLHRAGVSVHKARHTNSIRFDHECDQLTTATYRDSQKQNRIRPFNTKRYVDGSTWFQTLRGSILEMRSRAVLYNTVDIGQRSGEINDSRRSFDAHIGERTIRRRFIGEDHYSQRRGVFQNRSLRNSLTDGTNYLVDSRQTNTEHGQHTRRRIRTRTKTKTIRRTANDYCAPRFSRFDLSS